MNSTLESLEVKGKHQNPNVLQRAMPVEIPHSGSPIVIEYTKRSFWIFHEIVLAWCVVWMVFNLEIYLLSHPNQNFVDIFGLVIIAGSSFPFAYYLVGTDQPNYIVLNSEGILYRRGMRMWLVLGWKSITEFARHLNPMP